MKKQGLFLILIFLTIITRSQSLAGYAIYDYLVTAVHPYGCDPNYVTGPPEDSTWVNFNAYDTMTGTFGAHWAGGPGYELLLETSYHPDNYSVRMLLSTGIYSAAHPVNMADWQQIADTPWVHIFIDCTSGMFDVERYIRPLDFEEDFGLLPLDVVTGIEIVFLDTPGAPDLAGVYIIAGAEPCDTIDLGADTTLCEGEILILDATTPNATYLWQDNSTNPTFTVTQTGTYWVQVSVGTCITSDTIVVSFNPIPAITNNPLFKSICTGESTNILLTSTVQNTLFSWTANGSSPFVTGYSSGSGGVINQILTNSGVTNESVIYTITPEANDCTGDPVPYTVTVTPRDTVDISIAASEDSVCEGMPVTFTATPVNGGTNPFYQWQINGINAGTNDPIYTFIPVNGDLVRCIITSSETCTFNNPASSTQHPVSVNPLLPVSITITPPANPICEGDPVTFSATPVNAGASPLFQWQVNGINTGTNSQVFTFSPVNGDHVSCILTSSESCTSSNPVSSYPVIVTVLESPEVTFTPCFDTITTTTAKPIRLKGGIPLGGTYSGPGVANGYFYPSVAGPGNHLITYSYTNSALCIASRYSLLVTRLASPFNCGEDLLDFRDSSLYSTIQIGNQCWFAENLTYGAEILFATPQRDNCIPEKYLQPPPGLPQPGEGSVYQWDELMQYNDTPGLQGLCPPGWHIPSEPEWNQLFTFFQNNAFAGSPLKYSGYSGFNAFLNGTVFFNRDWYFEDFATFFWSSTTHGPYKAWAHGMNEENYSVSLYPAFRANAFSVRCLRD